MSIPTLLNEALNPEKVSISGDTETQIDNFFFEDSCAGFLANETETTSCQGLMKGLLLRGY